MSSAPQVPVGESTLVIRVATRFDDAELHRLAALDSARPLGGTVIVAQSDGRIDAALSIDEGRAVADPFRPTAHLLASMRVRARGLQAVEHMPSLRERLLAGLPTTYRARLAGRRA
jgi:hypothetical protein